MEKETTVISIPKSLYQRVEKVLADLKADSVEDYIIKILEEKLPPAESESELSQAEEDKIKERLKALGYMD